MPKYLFTKLMLSGSQVRSKGSSIQCSVFGVEKKGQGTGDEGQEVLYSVLIFRCVSQI